MGLCGGAMGDWGGAIGLLGGAMGEGGGKETGDFIWTAGDWGGAGEGEVNWCNRGLAGG